jgi:hypothetical protein
MKKSGTSKKSGAPTKSAAPAAGGSGEMYGEGNWKADEEYRQGLKEFSETHDAAAIAREAADDLDDEVEEASKGKPAPDENEW